MILSRTLLTSVVLIGASALVRGQTVDDGVMMAKRSLCTGVVYSHDQWEQYWEGPLKRTNGNIGHITTQSLSWVGAYGITDRLNVLATIPYVWTGASQGVLHGMSGFQDLSLAAKLTALETSFTSKGTLRAILVGAVGTPLSSYTPDFYPLSIGSHSRRASGRLTVDYRARAGWFLHGSGAYTWRGNVTLDRPSYFTDGQLFLSDEVAMPDVFDYVLSLGYRSDRLHVPVSFVQQITRGGGDIRRQDAPFVSNRMNFSKLDAVVQYQIPRARNLAVRGSATYTLTGRNVGQATTLAGGLLYTFHF